MGLPLFMPAPLELERAGDPEVACVEADDLVAGVKDSPVARPRTPGAGSLRCPQLVLHDYGPAPSPREAQRSASVPWSPLRHSP
jgi:hypothetical protein